MWNKKVSVLHFLVKCSYEENSRFAYIYSFHFFRISLKKIKIFRNIKLFLFFISGYFMLVCVKAFLNGSLFVLEHIVELSIKSGLKVWRNLFMMSLPVCHRLFDPHLNKIFLE